MIIIVLLTFVTNITNGELWGSNCETSADCKQQGYLQCVNSTCNCLAGYTNARNGMCFKTYSESCVSWFECNLDRILTCSWTSDVNNTCICQQPDRQIFDAERQSCVSRISHNCVHQADEFQLNCVEGAYCDMPIIGGVMYHVCACNPEWETTDEGVCLQIEFGDNLHDANCTSNEDCDERASLFCSENNKCECIEGHSVTKHKTCRRTFGEECVIDVHCNEDRFLKCTNEVGFMTTVCDCENPTDQIYEDGSVSACVSLVGRNCSMQSGEFYLNCVEGAFCNMTHEEGEEDVMVHRCECSPGWTPTVNGTCVVIPE